MTRGKAGAAEAVEAVKAREVAVPALLLVLRTRAVLPLLLRTENFRPGSNESIVSSYQACSSGYS